MNKIILFIFTAICITLVAFLIFHNQPQKTGQACFGQNCFAVEIADTTAERELGLMYRQTLAEDKGMLFVYNNEDFYSFWMKKTQIPLDMIWIGQDNQVVFIKENAQPCPQQGDCPLINPDNAAKYVLEINAGLVEKFGIKTGDSVQINY